MKTSRWGECCFSRNLSSALVYSCSGHLGTLFAVLPKLLERSAHRICMCIDLKHLFCIKAMTIFCQTKLFYALISIIMGRLKSTGLSCLFVWILKYRIILSINHTQKAITGTSCLFNVYMSILSVHIITSRITSHYFKPHAREWSVNNLKQYENTPDAVMYSTWKKKK